jgi:hypothetical protein
VIRILPFKPIHYWMRVTYIHFSIQRGGGSRLAFRPPADEDDFIGAAIIETRDTVDRCFDERFKGNAFLVRLNYPNKQKATVS